MTQRNTLAAVLGIVLILGGCAANPARTADTEGYSDLYNGDMQLAHDAGQHETTRDEAVARGDRALADGNTDRAMYEYVHALEIGGGDAATLNKVGAIHSHLGNPVLAGRAYMLSLKLEPENPTALEGIGLLLLRDRRYEDSRKYLESALEKDPQRWQSHNGLGMIADLEGDNAQASAHYSMALEVRPGAEQRPDTALLLNNLGYSLYLSGDWQGAQENFRKALDYNPAFERAWQNLGLLYTRQGEYDKALDAFRHIMDKPEAYNNIGYLCMINRNYDQAYDFFQQAIRLSPTYYVKAHENLERLNRLRVAAGNGG